MTDNTYLLGIDFGTESVRAAIFDLAGRPVSFAATAYRTTHPHPGWAEQDPEEWWEALQASCRKVIAASGVSPAAIKGISYDATTMTVVAMDKRGEALRPAIMWMDVRATEQAARAEKSDSVARLYNGRGTAPATAERRRRIIAHGMSVRPARGFNNGECGHLYLPGRPTRGPTADHAPRAGQDNSRHRADRARRPGETTRCAAPLPTPAPRGRPRHDWQDRRRPTTAPPLGRTPP